MAMPALQQDRSGSQLLDELIIPEAIESERAVLGALMLESSLWNQAADLTADDFLSPSNRTIFRQMVEMREGNMPFNPVLLCDRLRTLGEYDRVGGSAYIASLLDGVPRFSKESDVLGYVFTIREKAIRRQLLRAADHVASQIADGATNARDIIQGLEERLYNLKASHSYQALPRLADDIDSYIDGMLNGEHRRSLVTFNAGLLDRRIVGPFPGDLIVIGARTSVGKTVLAMQAAMGTAQATHGDHDPVVAFFSLEMSREKLINRALQAGCGFPVNQWAMKNYTPSEIDIVRQTGRALKCLQMFTDETKRLNPNAIFTQCQKIKKQAGYLDLVVIDYLQLLEASARRQSEVAELSDISRNLKIVAGEIGCPFIVPAQLNRESTRFEEPRLEHLRGSGSIEQDADTVIFLHRPQDVDTEADIEPRKIIIAKQRDGYIGSMDASFRKTDLTIFAPEEF